MQCRLITSRNLPRECCFPGVASMADGEFRATSCWRNPIRVRPSHRSRRDLFFLLFIPAPWWVSRAWSPVYEWFDLGLFNPPYFRKIAEWANKIALNPQRDLPGRPRFIPPMAHVTSVRSIRFHQIDSANSLRAYLLWIVPTSPTWKTNVPSAYRAPTSVIAFLVCPGQ